MDKARKSNQLVAAVTNGRLPTLIDDLNNTMVSLGPSGPGPLRISNQYQVGNKNKPIIAKIPTNLS